MARAQIVSQLDPNIDGRSFRLGDMKVGDITVHIPDERGFFQGDFDFTSSKGFVLRVTAGIDVESSMANWVLEAIDPLTGEQVQDPDVGILLPNNAQGAGAGFVSYTVRTVADINTGDEIAAQARVLYNNAPPQDSLRRVHMIDAVAPVSQVTAEPLVVDSSDLLVNWQANDDTGGAGIKHVTVYVSVDGGDFSIWQRQTTESSAVFNGEPGRSYEFLTLATDNAGNREVPPPGISATDDGSGSNLGGLPDVGRTSGDTGVPAAPSDQPSTNPLFLESLGQIPATPPANGVFRVWDRHSAV